MRRDRLFFRAPFSQRDAPSQSISFLLPSVFFPLPPLLRAPFPLRLIINQGALYDNFSRRRGSVPSQNLISFEFFLRKRIAVLSVQWLWQSPSGALKIVSFSADSPPFSFGIQKKDSTCPIGQALLRTRRLQVSFEILSP